MNESAISLNVNGFLFIIIMGCLILWLFFRTSLSVNPDPARRRELGVIMKTLLITLIVIFFYANWRQVKDLFAVKSTAGNAAVSQGENNDRHYAEKSSSSDACCVDETGNDAKDTVTLNSTRRVYDRTFHVAPLRDANVNVHVHLHNDKDETPQVTSSSSTNTSAIKNTNCSTVTIGSPTKKASTAIAVQTAPPPAIPVQVPAKQPYTPMTVEERAAKVISENAASPEVLEVYITTNINASQASLSIDRMIEGIKKTFSSGEEKVKHSDIRTYEYHVKIRTFKGLRPEKVQQLRHDLEIMLSEFVIENTGALRDDFDFSVPKNRMQQSKFYSLFMDFVMDSAKVKLNDPHRHNWINWLSTEPVEAKIHDAWFTYPGMKQD